MQPDAATDAIEQNKISEGTADIEAKAVPCRKIDHLEPTAINDLRRLTAHDAGDNSSTTNA